MSTHAAHPASSALENSFSKQRVYKVIILMASTAIILSGAMITFFNQRSSASGAVSDGIYMAVETLMPYLFAAAIAAVTAIGILTMLPATRVYDPAQQILYRIRSLRHGDFQTRVQLRPNQQLRELGFELNETIDLIGDQLTQLKIINRQQWAILGRAQAAANMGDCAGTITELAKMEKNWQKIAQIEDKLMQ